MKRASLGLWLAAWCAATPAQDAPVRWRFAELKGFAAAPGWVTARAARTYSAKVEDGAVHFRVVGARTRMRWVLAKLPAEVDVGRRPYVTLRYRALGCEASSSYAVWVNGRLRGARGGAHVFDLRDLTADGRWHTATRRLRVKGALTRMAVGLDVAGASADLWLDYIAFSSRPPAGAGAEEDGLPAYRPCPDAAWKSLRPLAIPKPPAGAPDLSGRLGLKRWFAPRRILTAGAAFVAVPSLADAAQTGWKENAPVRVELPPGAREALLLIAAAWPKQEPSPFRPGRKQALWRVREPERFRIRIEYARGRADDVLPLHLATGRYEVTRGVDAYAVAWPAGRAAVRLTLLDGMSNASFALAAATANPGAPIGEAAPPNRPIYPRAKSAKARPTHKPVAEVAGRRLRIGDGLLDAEFDLSDGLRWRSLRCGFESEAQTRVGQAALFAVSDAEGRARGPWRVESANAAQGEFRVRLACADAPLAAEAAGRVTAAGELTLGLVVQNLAPRPQTLRVTFPRLAGLQVGDAPNTWYLVGREGGVIHHVAAEFRDLYGEPHPLQVDGFFNPRAGFGISLQRRCLEPTSARFGAGKDARGGWYELEYPERELKPGERAAFPPAAVIAAAGGWRAQLARYRAWTRSQRKSSAPRKRWFRRVFAFLDYIPWPRRGWTFEYRVDLLGRVNECRSLVGACDYLHLYGWQWAKGRGLYGDYDAFDGFGGVERFLAEVKRCQAAGVRVGLYLDPYLLSVNAKHFADRGEQWCIRSRTGRPHTWKHKAYFNCLAVPEWTRYILSRYVWAAERLGADGLYLDTYGHGSEAYFCYSRAHGHRVPLSPLPGEYAFAKRLRDAVGPAKALYSEFVPPDVFAPRLDGAFGHAVYHAPALEALSPHGVDLYRFAFPDFKIFQLFYKAPLRDGNVWLLKFPFFNGEGTFLAFWSILGWDEQARALAGRIFRIQREHADAFAGDDAEPLVPTLAAGVYANRFACAGETVWTLYNANFRTVRGPLLRVKRRGRVTYEDAWSGLPVRVKPAGDEDELSFELAPRGVGCIVARASAD